MRLLVDGNNLMFALAEVAIDADRAELPRILARFAQRQGVAATVVFDGRPHRPRGAEDVPPEGPAGVEIYYSGTRTADEVLAELVDADSAPRQLMVVSSDRQVQKYARRRRCKVIDALDFARLLKAPAAPRRLSEPRDQMQGLRKGQVDKWLKEFGLGSISKDSGEK
jgi:predicted RNA-binding protein with PIN domain